MPKLSLFVPKEPLALLNSQVPHHCTQCCLLINQDNFLRRPLRARTSRSSKRSSSSRTPERRIQLPAPLCQPKNGATRVLTEAHDIHLQPHQPHRSVHVPPHNPSVGPQPAALAVCFNSTFLHTCLTTQAPQRHLMQQQRARTRRAAGTSTAAPQQRKATCLAAHACPRPAHQAPTSRCGVLKESATRSCTVSTQQH